MCGKLPATLALFAVLGPLHPRTIKPFLPSFLSRRHSREKRYQALSRFTVLIATESWAGPGNEAISLVFFTLKVYTYIVIVITPRLGTRLGGILGTRFGCCRHDDIITNARRLSDTRQTLPSSPSFRVSY